MSELVVVRSRWTGSRLDGRSSHGARDLTNAIPGTDGSRGLIGWWAINAWRFDARGLLIFAATTSGSFSRPNLRDKKSCASRPA